MSRDGALPIGPDPDRLIPMVEPLAEVMALTAKTPA